MRAALLLLERGTWYRAETDGAFNQLTPGEEQEWLAALDGAHLCKSDLY